MRVPTNVLIELSIASVSADGLRLTLTRQVEYKLYRSINEVLEALGGRWLRKDRVHVFEADVRSRLEATLASGDVTTAADLGFFETPEDLAKHLVQLADVNEADFCLEPSAGKGRIIDALDAVGAWISAFERDADRRAYLTRKYANRNQIDVYDLDDFMAYETSEPFDRVVMNPPFLRCGLGDHLDHVRHAYDMLVPGGVLVAVLPRGIEFRQDRRHREFRAWAEARGPIAALSETAFRSSGTNVRTSVVRLVRGL